MRTYSKIKTKPPEDIVRETLQLILNKMIELENSFLSMNRVIKGLEAITRKASTKTGRYQDEYNTEIMPWNANGLLNHKQVLRAIFDVNKIDV